VKGRDHENLLLLDHDSVDVAAVSVLLRAVFWRVKR